MKRTVKCKSCGKLFNQLGTLRRHMSYFHNDDGQKEDPTCYYCGKSFTRFENMEKHVNITHFNQRDYKCNRCNKLFTSFRTLKNHIHTVIKTIIVTGATKNLHSHGH